MQIPFSLYRLSLVSSIFCILLYQIVCFVFSYAYLFAVSQQLSGIYFFSFYNGLALYNHSFSLKIGIKEGWKRIGRGLKEVYPSLPSTNPQPTLYQPSTNPFSVMNKCKTIYGRNKQKTDSNLDLLQSVFGVGFSLFE